VTEIENKNVKDNYWIAGKQLHEIGTKILSAKYNSKGNMVVKAQDVLTAFLEAGIDLWASYPVNEENNLKEK